jgi:hypothetical protein
LEQEKQVISQDSPFYGDKLERRTVATYLTNYLIGKYTVSRNVQKYRSFVLNLNSEWGAGKTYFLTEWAKQFREDRHLVITFDAWKNDFSKQPLIGFMSEIEAQLRKQLAMDEQVIVALDGLIDKGKKLIKVVAPTLIFHAIKAVSGIDAQAIKDSDWTQVAESASLGGASDKLGEKIKEQLYKENEDTKQAIAAFKAQLKKIIELIAKSGDKKLPLFFFVDELDRCRPNFSIELLEDIKHLFGIDDVYFVVATDSAQLAHSIQAVYGQGFDARTYLRRFFDQEYSLPEPNRFNFSCHLFSEYGLDREVRLFSPLDHRRYKEQNLCVLAFSLCADYFRLPLRDQDQACAMLDAIRLTSSPMTLHVLYLAFLIMLRLKDHDLFDAYCKKQIGMPTIIEKLSASRSIDQSISLDELRMTASGAYSDSAQQLFEVVKVYAECAGATRQVLEGKRSRTSTAESIISRLIANQGEAKELREYPELVKSASALIHLL